MRLPAAVPWLVLAAVPALTVTLLSRRPDKAEGADTTVRGSCGFVPGGEVVGLCQLRARWAAQGFDGSRRNAVNGEDQLVRTAVPRAEASCRRRPGPSNEVLVS
ncbi:hypothetical protein APS67_002861 [Streptomyces sp. AVP053U2]|nr:hypothetical protein APS67_002861 [Streptomyces sp. AVP053U2]